MNHIRKRGRRYEVRMLIDGKPFNDKFSDLEHAKLFVRKTQLDHDLGRLDMSPKGPEMTMEAAGKVWLPEAQLRLAPNTVNGYRCRWEAFIVPELGTRAVKSVTTGDIQRFLSQRLGAGVQPVTVDHDRIALCSFFSWAVRAGIVNESPMRRVEKLRFAPLRPRRALTDEEALKCAEVLEPPSRLAFILAVFTGMRASELCRLRWEDVDLEQGRLTVRNVGREHTKTYEGRVVPIHPAVDSQLRAAPRKGAYVLPGRKRPQRLRDLRGIIGQAVKLSGVRPFRWHDLRHTFATWLRRAGVSLEDIAYLLGHSDLRSTLIYAREDLGQLTKAVQRLLVGPPAPGPAAGPGVPANQLVPPEQPEKPTAEPTAEAVPVRARAPSPRPRRRRRRPGRARARVIAAR